MDIALLKNYVDEVIRLSIEMNVVKKERDEWKEKYEKLVAEKMELDKVCEQHLEKAKADVEKGVIMAEIVSAIQSVTKDKAITKEIAVVGDDNKSDDVKDKQSDVKVVEAKVLNIVDEKKDKRREYMKEYMRKKRQEKKKMKEST